MPPPLTRELRDPIHGLVRVTEQELAIINTPVFQRLRRIRQLAMADLVYPGALHTRFEHSIGAMHLAHRILTRLADLRADQPGSPGNITEEDWRAIRLAALLHDVGHGPFSHVSEELLDRHYDPAQVGTAAAKEKIHELLTIDIITKAPELAGLLDADECNLVTSIIRGFSSRDFRHDLISGDLDVDKMDYLLRDAHFAGVRYGQYDLDKVIDAFRVKREQNESYAAVADDGIFAVEQLVLSKHHMTQQVYSHRVRTITDQMIVRGLELAIQTDPAMRAIYRYDGSTSHLTGFLAADDNIVIGMIINGSDDRAKNLFQRLRERRLYKELAVIQIDQKNVPSAVPLQRLRTLTEGACTQLEAKIAAQLGCQPWEVIVRKKRVRHPAYQDPGRLDPEAILVMTRSGELQALTQFSELVEAREPDAHRLHVIGPFEPDKSLTETERREERQRLDREIRAVIGERIGGSL